jgi:hypothetical protein
MAKGKVVRRGEGAGRWVERRNFGRPGHFIAADSCRFHLHTHVNGYCISTVGEYWMPQLPGRPAPTAPTSIGYNRLYETMVFPLGDDDEPSDWSGLECAAYNDADAADAGHEAIVRQYQLRGAKAEQVLVDEASRFEATGELDGVGHDD